MLSLASSYVANRALLRMPEPLQSKTKLLLLYRLRCCLHSSDDQEVFKRTSPSRQRHQHHQVSHPASLIFDFVGNKCLVSLREFRRTVNRIWCDVLSFLRVFVPAAD
jgi:hypothetical protein